MSDFSNLEPAIEAMQYNSMTLNRVYKNQKEILFPKEKGSIVVTLLPKFDYVGDILDKKSGLQFYRCGYRTFIAPTMFNTKIGTKVLKINKGQKTRTAFLKMVNNRGIKFLSASMADNIFQNKTPCIYDISESVELYQKYKLNRSVQVSCNQYMNYIGSILPKNDYANRILYIPLDIWAAEGKVIGINQENFDHPVSIFLRCLYKYPAYLESLKGYTIMLSNMAAGEILKFAITDDMISGNNSKKEYARLRVLLGKLHIVVAPESSDSSSKEKDETNDSSSYSASSNNSTPSVVAESIKKTVVANVTKRLTGTQAIQSMDNDTSTSEQNIIEDEAGDNNVSESNDELAEEIADTVNTFISENPDILESDPGRLEEMATNEVKRKVFAAKFIPERTEKELENILQLDKQQKQIIEQDIDVLKSKMIDSTSFEGAIETDDKNILESKFVNFEKNYAEKRYKYDVDKAVAGLSNGSSKIFITNREEVDSSDQFNQKTTVIYTLKDEQGRVNTLKLDIPRLIDGNYIYIGGSRKLIGKQRLFKPIVKTGPDTVQLVTFYNKCFITRYGQTVDSKNTNLVNFIKNNAKKYNVVFGNSKVYNAKYNTSIDFDTFAKCISRITIRGKNKEVYEIVFNLEKLKEELDSFSPDQFTTNYDPEEFDTSDGHIFGYMKNVDDKITLMRTSTEETFTDKILRCLPEEDANTIKASSKSTGRFMYARMRIMSKFIPLVLFTLFCDGFTVMMNKCNIEYEVFDSVKEFRKAHSNTDESFGLIKLADKVIAYRDFPTENSLLLNGLRGLPMENYTLEELDSKDTYIDMLPLFYASSSMAFNLDQFKDFMIDEKTKEILIDFGLPTDLTQLLFHACKLLKNNQYLLDNNMMNMRIRSSEIIAQEVYQVLTQAYGSYRKTAHKKKPAKISVPQDAVIKALLSTSLVNDDLTLNPYYTLESERGVTIKASVSTPPGKPTITLTGTNRVDGYGMNKRAFDPTMTGVFGITTSADANVGIQRQLTLEPSITSTNGYVECVRNKEDIEALTNANLLTPTELTTPTVLYDDPIRSSMMRGQTSKMLMTEDMSPLLIGNKTESVIAYHIPDTLCFKAKDNGRVIDEKDGVYIVEYNNGKREAFDTNPTIMKSTDGMDIEIKLTPYISVGQKFKKMQVLASDKRAFTKNQNDLGASANIGVLAKAAIASIYDIYEDSEPISAKLSERLAAQAIEKKDAVLAANTYVESIVKIGDHVSIGDPLMVFDPDSGDPEVAKFLQEYSKGGNINEALVQTGKSIIKAPVSGEITEIEIWRTVDMEELSPSLAKIVTDYNKRIDSKRKFLDKYKNEGDNDYYKCNQLMTHTTEKVDTNFGKIMGVKVDDGVLIRFHIKHRDVIKKGDKVANFCAMKGVTSHIMPEGQEPWSSFRPDEEVSCIIAPLSVSARKTPAIFRFLWGNKVLIEGKRKLLEDYFKD